MTHGRNRFPALVMFLSGVAVAAHLFFSGAFTTQATQNPTISLDMVTTGTSYDDTTNTMTVGAIDSCSSSPAPGDNTTHILPVDVDIQNVEDLIGWQIRLNYDGGKMRPSTANFTPFTDSTTGQNISFVNLPIDSATTLHRAVFGSTSIPAAAPGPQTALIGSNYLGAQTAPVSPDTPAKTIPDDTSYSAPSGGVVATLNLQVLAGNAGQLLSVDVGTSPLPPSKAIVFTGSGSQDILPPEGNLGDGLHGEGVPCPATTPTPSPTPTGVATPTPTSTAIPTPTATRTPTSTPTRTPRPTAHAASPPRNAPPGSATTYQLNALHDGHGLGGLLPPLTRAWSLALGATVGYPLVVNGRVFVATENAGGNYGAQLYAIDEHAGVILWGPIALPGTYFINGIAADGANVYSVNFDGLLRAFDQATGTQIWQKQLPGQYAFTSPPTVAGGTVFVSGAGSGGTVYAVSAATGSVLWTASVENGDHSSPAVTSNGVYVSYACEVSYRFDPTTGHRIWIHTTDCEGGGGRTPVVHGDRVYIRDDAGKTPVVLRTADGSIADTFSSVTAPAFDGNLGFYVQSHGFGSALTLTAVDLTSDSVRWTQTGDGTFSTAPLVIDSKVVMGSSSGMVALYDENTGALVWSGNAGARVQSPDEHNAGMLVGLAGADNMLFVPASTTLVAYRGAGSTPSVTPTSTLAGCIDFNSTTVCTPGPTGSGPTPTPCIDFSGTATCAPF